MRSNLLVHDWLGETWLIALVMAEAAIAKHVDHDRLMKFLSKLDRDLRGVNNGFGIIAVHVENRRLDHFRGVRRIGRRSRITRRCGEPNLIIDDEMNRTAGPITFEAGKA